MIESLSRRLRVRDDGTGNGRESAATLAEFDPEDAIVLLGDPGLGKTTLFREAAGENYVTVRTFLVAPRLPKNGGAIFLDGLDEFRTTKGSDASDEVAKTLYSLARPKFRISCRAADWLGSLDQEIFRVASPSGRVVVLELCPLTHDEISKVVQNVIEDPAAFINDAESAGLGVLLGNPQTLTLMAAAWAKGKRPQNKFEAYEMGVSELLRETNTYHSGRGLGNPHPEDLRKAAGAVGATILLSGSIGVSRSESAEGPDYVKTSLIPYKNKNDLNLSLGRRLFISPETDRLELIHRTIAEFIAAEDLSNRIRDGLPIDRVMALICGFDGKPVASLRGLFAWLLCRLGSSTEAYVDRDPYALATYGDPSILSPSAQCAIWKSLRKLRDPWFLSNEDDRGSFRGLANLNTVEILKDLLQDEQTGVHLRVAVLEAIAQSTDDLGMTAIIRAMIVDKQELAWIRKTALKAYVQIVRSDWAILKQLDSELVIDAMDGSAPDLRAYLLNMTADSGCLSERVLSVLQQAASAPNERPIIGRFYRLLSLPKDLDLDAILDGSKRMALTDGRSGRFELRPMFMEWLRKRLESPVPIPALQLASWLQNILGDSHQLDSESCISLLNAKFRNDPRLFEEIFQSMLDAAQDRNELWLFLVDRLWHMLPPKVWPFPPCEYFLKCAQRQKDPIRAADLFRLYLSHFPSAGAPISLTEAGWSFLESRLDVERELGNWTICQIQEWHQERARRRLEDAHNHSLDREHNIELLTPRIESLRGGNDESVLAWAAHHYLGFNDSTDNASGPRERLVKITNDEIADSLIHGFTNYVTNRNLPTVDEIIQCQIRNSIPYTHSLLSLSTFMRKSAGMTIPEDALPSCLAAAITGFNAGDNLPGYDEGLSEWIRFEVKANSSVAKEVFTRLWVGLASREPGNLQGFDELKKDPGSKHFLTELSASVLRSGITGNYHVVQMLISVLLLNDRHEAQLIAEHELARPDISAEVRSVWGTVLFILAPSNCSDVWQELMSGPENTLWPIIEFIGERIQKLLTCKQRADLVAGLGARFTNAEHPSHGWSGARNPWNASEFISKQITILATDLSEEADLQLERLEQIDLLASYHDLIRNQRAQHEKRRRESSFIFASPERVAKALQNGTPATSNDLLALVIEHLQILGREIRKTQRERYRAYWNEDGRRNLLSPKHEEDCSGFLAEDLQSRVQHHGLIVTVEHHMVREKECDLVVLQATERLLPIEVKHHFNDEIWTGWDKQLDKLYASDAKADGLGIYLVVWSGEGKDRMMPRLPDGIVRPQNADEMRSALNSLIPEKDRQRLRVVVVDISKPE